MIFIGFGFLMTFLKRYGFSAVSINMLLAVFTIQWGIIVRGMASAHNGFKFTISLEQLLTADFAAAVILISMGAMLGKLSPSQYVIMAFFETPVALIVEHICVHNLQVYNCDVFPNIMHSIFPDQRRRRIHHRTRIRSLLRSCLCQSLRKEGTTWTSKRGIYISHRYLRHDWSNLPLDLLAIFQCRCCCY